MIALWNNPVNLSLVDFQRKPYCNQLVNLSIWDYK